MATAPKKKEKPYLSPTQIEMVSNCGEQYRRRYLEGDIIPPGIALIKGSAVHLGAEENFRQKIESREDLPQSQIVDRAVSAFEDKERAEGLFLSAEEEARGKKIVKGEGIDSTARLAGLYAREVAPKYQPKEVEIKQRLVLPSAKYDLLAILDVVREDGNLLELKTGAKKKSQGDWDTSTQLTIQAITQKAHSGKLPEKITVEQMVDSGKSPPKLHTFETTRTAADFKPMAARLNAITKLITAGVFVPASPGWWGCSPKYCGYYRTCEFVNVERKAATIATEKKAEKGSA